MAVVISVALFYFSCSSDLNLNADDEPDVAAVPSDVIKDWTDYGENLVDDVVGNWTDCGGKLGVHACNFIAKNQHEQNWQLYDHYGKIIVLDFSALWCGVCMNTATHVQEFQDTYGSENVVWVTVLLQDFNGQLPDVELATLWADTFNIKTSPVLAANESVIELILADGYAISVLPTIVIINRDMINAYVMEGWNKNRLINQIETMLLAEI
jgi:thiol-disulfide isomerase/thioredoxin